MSAREYTNFWIEDDYDQLELLHAHYVTHRFAPHAHEGFAIGVITAGAETFTYRKNRHCAGKGAIATINPGEIHPGEAFADFGWEYRMFYPSMTLMQEIATSVSGLPSFLPYFDDTVINDDPYVARLLVNAHRVLEISNDRLEKDSALHTAFSALIERHAIRRNHAPFIDGSGITHQANYRIVRDICDYIRAHHHENLTLDDLAARAGFSPFHFLRVFKAFTTMSPHQYMTHVRVEQAKSYLLQGNSIIDTALETGFANQSHFTRAFKRVVGVTPGNYRLSA